MRREMKLFIDESGTTGVDLNNQGTPVFTLASNNLWPIEAKSIITEIFGRDAKKEELKYVDIKVQAPELVVKLVERMASRKQNFACYLIHKPYALIVQLVRFFYISWLEAKGNKLDPSIGVVFANLCYIELRNAEHNAEFWSIMQLFQAMMGRYDISNYNKFWEALADYQKTYAEIGTIDSLLKAWYDWDSTQFYKSLFHDSRRHALLHVHMSALIATIAFWRERHPSAGFEVVHDECSDLKKLKRTFQSYCKPKKQKSWSGYSFDVQFPLPVNFSTFDANSQDYPQIELSDLLAGSVADFFGAHYEPNSVRSSYHDELWKAGLGYLLAGAVAPNPWEALNEFTSRHRN